MVEDFLENLVPEVFLNTGWVSLASECCWETAKLAAPYHPTTIQSRTAPKSIIIIIIDESSSAAAAAAASA